jgi:parallel beta-helix repeat protein
VRALAFSPHPPISITSNAGFTNASGVVWGNGTLADPYVIDGWDINASSSAGIYISNTNAYFRISNCYVHDGADLYDGIHLYLVSNANLSSCELDMNKRGVNAEEVSGSVLYGNFMDRNIIDLYIDACDYVFARENTMYSGIVFFNGAIDDLAPQAIDSSNTVDGKPVFFVKDQSGLTVPANIGQALIFNCSDVAVQGLSLNHPAIGIEMALVTNVTIRDVAIFNCSFMGLVTHMVENGDIGGVEISGGSGGMWCISSTGISLHDSTISDTHGMKVFSSAMGGVTLSSTSYCAVYNNVVSNNHGYGIDVVGSYNRIWNNLFVGNNGASGTYNPSHVQARDYVGTGNEWNSTDGRGNYWGDWISPDVAPADGIVDTPYAIDGGKGAKDNHPLASPPEPIPEIVNLPIVAAALLIVVLMSRGRRRRSLL